MPAAIRRIHSKYLGERTFPKEITEFEIRKFFTLSAEDFRAIRIDRRFNEAVKRNIGRFPEDFMLRLTRAEHTALISQIATSNPGRGGRHKLPWAFTEHGAIQAANRHALYCAEADGEGYLDSGCQSPLRYHRIASDSASLRPSSNSSTGTRPFGFLVRKSGLRVAPS